MTKSKSLTYLRWKGMKSRCYAPSFKGGKNKYQELGIVVCKQWKNSFDNFLQDMGECSEGYSLERINPLGNYEPNNCKWILKEEQPKNRTNSLYYTIGNETKLLKDWAKEYKISYTTLRHRVLIQNMNIIEAIKHTNLITYKGKQQSVKDWCKELGISYTKVVTKRKRSGLSYPEIFDFYLT